MARSTINISFNSKASLVREIATLQTELAKIRASDIVPGADLKVGNVRVQVAEVQESPIRAFARAEGIPVGSRGRFSQELQERYAAHLKAEAKAKRAARKAEREHANA